MASPTDGREFEHTPGDSEGQGSLRAAVHRVAELDTIEQPNKKNVSSKSALLPAGLLRAVPVFPAGTDAPNAGYPGPSRAPQFPRLSGPHRAGQTASSGH